MNPWLHKVLPRDAQNILINASLKASECDVFCQKDLRRLEQILDAAIHRVRTQYPHYFKE